MRRLVRLARVLTLALTGAAAVAAPSLAARGHEYAGAFGWGVSSGATELQRCGSEASCKPGLQGNGPGQFNNPDGIAVNEATHEIYVVDKNNNRVEIFNSTGSKFEGEFNGSGLLPNEGKAAGSGGLPEEVPSGAFKEPEGIAVDNSCARFSEPKKKTCEEGDPSSGDVYVVDTRGHKGGSFEEERMVIDKYDPTGKYIGQITRNPDPTQPFSEHGFQSIFGMAVGQNGEVWVEEKNFGGVDEGAANYTNAVANAWIAFRSTKNGLSAGVAAGPAFAVDAKSSQDNLYVHNTFGSGDRLGKFKTESKPPPNTPAELLSAEVDEEAPTGVGVEATSSDVYVAHAANVHRLNSSLESEETLILKAGAPSFSGVAVDAQTLTVYVADPAMNRVEVFTPESPGPPTVQPASEAVTDVSATSASFGAEVNPRSEENEAPTSYAFQYGPCESASPCPASPYPQSTPIPEGTLAANYEPDQIAAHPQDLAPHTVYHMRVVAHNSKPEAANPTIVHGEELIFTTQGSAASVLPDSRQWELVSPADKHGAVIAPISEGLIQAAANGDAISYLTNAPSEAEPPGFSLTEQVLSRRTPGSWQSQDIATPHEAPAGVTLGPGRGEYRFFSEGLESAIVQPFGPFTQAVSPQASEQTLYLRSNFPAGDPSHPCGASCYRPLVSGCPGGGEPCPGPVEEVANVPEGTKFGAPVPGGLFFLGASPDASHVVFTAPAKLSEEAPEESLYEWGGGKLALVSVLPGGQAALPATTPVLGALDHANGTVRIARQAISADGSRVVWSAGELDGEKHLTGNHHLYLRNTAAGHEQTIQLDRPEAGCTTHCKGTAAPIFQTASKDDSRIFFTDPQPLTQQAGNSDLYECEVEEPEEEEEPRCKLSDLTPPGAGQEGGGALGLLAGAAEDGSSVYFTANGKLSEGPNAHGEEAVAGNCSGITGVGTPESETAPERCNLYAHANGQTRLIAVLSGADFPDWSVRKGGLAGLTDRVSSDGRHLAFMSRLPLSGYDNRDALSGKADEEVFLYDAGANGGQGGVSCASCNPTGARPHGIQYRRIDANEGNLAGGAGVWPANAWIAASIPGFTPLSEGEGFALHQPRYLSNSGRLFFNAADALVPQDVNRSEDVYQYEPAGIRNPEGKELCSEAMETFSPDPGGCVALISSGTGKEESALLDASESGEDVFFLTAQRLLPAEDLDASADVYDAHACSGASPCLPAPAVPPPACEGDACQSPGSAPEDQTPGSLTYQGPGNLVTSPVAPVVKPKAKPLTRAQKLANALKACHGKRISGKRRVCERSARKQYAPVKSKKRGKR